MRSEYRKTIEFFCLLTSMGCTLKTIPPTIQIKPRLDLTHSLPAHSARFNDSTKLPVLAVDFDCFFAAVDDVGPTFSASGVTATQLACMGMNNVSSLAFQSAASIGLDLSVTAGANRTIRFFGVQTALGTSCTGKSLKDLFTQSSAPAIYEVGSVTQEIKIGKSITVPATFGTGQSNYKDLYSICTDRLALQPVANYKGNLDPTVNPLNTGANLPPSGSTSALNFISATLSLPLFAANRSNISIAGAAVYLLFKIPAFGSAITEYKKLSIRAEADAGDGTDCPEGSAANSTSFALETFKDDGTSISFATKNSQSGVVSFETTASEAATLNQYFFSQMDSGNGISSGSYLNMAFLSATTSDTITNQCNFIRLKNVFATLSK